MNPYTVDVFQGRITLKRNGVPMRDNGQFPKCFCCHPNDPLWQLPERTFTSIGDAWKAADHHHGSTQ